MMVGNGPALLLHGKVWDSPEARKRLKCWAPTGRDSHILRKKRWET